MNSILLEVNNFRIVVIDDNVDAADMFGWLLEAEGYKAEVRYSASAGLELTSKFEPHVVFCDLGMPVMSGYDFAREFRAQDLSSRPLLVAVSGWNDERTRMRTKNAGFDAHLVKPASLSDIVILLQEYSKKMAECI